MKLPAIFCSLVLSAFAATPTLVRVTHQSLMPNASSCQGSPCLITNGGVFTLPLVDPTAAGNTLIMGLSIAPNSGGGCAFVGGDVTDDQSNTWVLGPASGLNSNGQYTFILYVLSAAVNTRVVTVHNAHCASSGNTRSLHVKVDEWNNISALDGTPSCNSGTSTTAVTSGAITTASNGSLIWVYVNRTNAQPNLVASFTAGVAGAGFTLSAADDLDGNATEYQIQASAGAINPDFTMATSANWQACGIAFAAGTAGSGIPSGIHVIGLYHETWVQGTATTRTLQIPCRGNLLVLESGGNYHWLINSITDSGSNTWHNTGSQINNLSAATEGVETWYVFGPSVCSPTYTLTITWNSTSSGHGGTLFYDIANAAASPFDVDTHTTADGICCSQNDPAGQPVTTPSITPSVANTLMLCEMPVSFNTVGAASGVTGIQFDASTYTGEFVSGPEPIDQNNGWAHANLSGTTAQSVTWSQFYPADSRSFRNYVARCNTWLSATAVTARYQATGAVAVTGSARIQ